MLTRRFKNSEEKVPPQNKGKVYPDRNVDTSLIHGVTGKHNWLYQGVRGLVEEQDRQEGWKDGGFGHLS